MDESDKLREDVRRLLETVRNRPAPPPPDEEYNEEDEDEDEEDSPIERMPRTRITSAVCEALLTVMRESFDSVEGVFYDNLTQDDCDSLELHKDDKEFMHSEIARMIEQLQNVI